MESQPWPGSLPKAGCDHAGPLVGQVHVQKVCGGELLLGCVQNQVMNLPHKCHLKLVGVIEAISVLGVLLSSVGTAAVGLPAFCFLQTRTTGTLVCFLG